MIAGLIELTLKVVAAYLLGSVLGGDVMRWLLGGADLRASGSGNVGATNALRELGGVLGIAILGTVFTSHGSYVTPQAYVNGLVPALWVGAAVLAAGALIAAALPFSTRASAAANAAAEAGPATVPATLTA